MSDTTEKIKEERFRMPSSKEIIEMAMLFNDGEIDRKALTNMVAMCQFVVDRLHGNGDILIPSSQEVKDNDNQES